MRSPNLKKILLLAVVITLAACSTDFRSAAKPPVAPAPERISYTDITCNTVPQGAAVLVNGQFWGYSPVIIHARLINGNLPEPIFIDFKPTDPGQFSQSGSIGMWSSRFGPKTSITAYMYDTGIYARAAQLGG
jgi:hypothetical protein